MSDDDWRRARKSRSRKGESERDFPDEMVWSPPPASTAVASRPARREASPTSGPEVAAVVSRFDAARGFGFVTLDTGGEAFLHISALQRFGADTVAPKARLQVRIGQGQKGPQVVEVVGIDGADRGAAVAEPIRGTVKWYNSEKGFGFVALESGGADVFVHATALQRSGLPSLTDGQAVKVRVIQGKKGPEVESLDID